MPLMTKNPLESKLQVHSLRGRFLLMLSVNPEEALAKNPDELCEVESSFDTSALFGDFVL